MRVSSIAFVMIVFATACERRTDNVVSTVETTAAAPDVTPQPTRTLDEIVIFGSPRADSGDGID